MVFFFFSKRSALIVNSLEFVVDFDCCAPLLLLLGSHGGNQGQI